MAASSADDHSSLLLVKFVVHSILADLLFAFAQIRRYATWHCRVVLISARLAISQGARIAVEVPSRAGDADGPVLFCFQLL